nr:hypothetical protein [Tanacetum cinerariifolium]
TIMSDSEDSTVTYTTVFSPYKGRLGDVSPGVDGPPVMPEDPYTYVVAAFQALPPPDYVLAPRSQTRHHPHPFTYLMYRSRCTQTEEQPLPAAVSPTAESPGYIPESDPDEDPKEDDDEDLEEDPADYPTNHDDDEEEEEPSGDDADEEDEEQDEGDDDEEEEHPASTDSIPPPLHSVSRLGYLSDTSRQHCPSLRRMLRDFWICLFPHHHHLLHYHLHYHKYRLPHSQHHPL